MENYNNDDSKKERFKNAIAYIPWLALILFFVKDSKSEEFQKNIRYGIYFLLIYALICIVIWIFMYSTPIILIIFFVYIALSCVYGYMAYKWNDINIYIIDKIHEKLNP